MFITLKQLKEALIRLLNKVMEEINNLRKNSYTKEEVDELLAEGNFGGGAEEIYIGGGDFPEGYKLQIDTSGDATGIVEDVQYNGKSVVDKDTSVATIPSLIVVGEDSSEDWVMRINPDEEGATSVEDVQINGASIVNDGVANIPMLGEGENNIGLVKLYEPDVMANGGLLHWATSGPRKGCLTINVATEQSIDKRWSNPIGGSMNDYAVKAAMCDGKGAAWTPEEKSAARMRLGEEWRYIGKVETTEDVVRIIMNLDSNGQPFSLRKIRVLSVVKPNVNNFTGWIKITCNDVWGTDSISNAIDTSNIQRISDVEIEKIGEHLRVNNVWKSHNASNASLTLCIPNSTVCNAYSYTETPFTDDGINKISFESYQAGIGIGSYIEVWGVDA